MQQVGGTNVIGYYFSAVLIESFGFSNRMALVLAVVDFINFALWTLLGSFIMDRVGRKTLFLIGAVGRATCFGMASLGLAIGTKTMSAFVVAFIFAFYIFEGTAFAPIPFIYPSEINSHRMRNTGAAIAVGVQWLFVYVVVLVTPTAGLSLEQVDELFNLSLAEGTHMSPKQARNMILQAGAECSDTEKSDRDVSQNVGSLAEDFEGHIIQGLVSHGRKDNVHDDDGKGHNGKGHSDKGRKGSNGNHNSSHDDKGHHGNHNHNGNEHRANHHGKGHKGHGNGNQGNHHNGNGQNHKDDHHSKKDILCHTEGKNAKTWQEFDMGYMVNYLWSDTWIATLIAGLLGTISGIIAPFAAAAEGAAAVAIAGASGGAGAGSGITSMGNGIATGVMTSADEVIQNEINSLGDLEKAMTKSSDILYRAVRKWGINVMNTAPDNTHKHPNKYSHANRGAPEILHSGTFADPATAQVNVKIDNHMINAFYGAAISALWTHQNVFIVTMKGHLPFHAQPCDIDLSDDVKRVCDGDRAYFFVKKDWTAVPGVHKLDKWNLDLLSVAKASRYTQKRHGYNAQWDSKAAIKVLMSEDPPPKNLFINLP
ncbi:general substrate transporter, partial [Penicillium riverlandense]|uniref:general substrate transporter n=1 Tax=Penicillium riverlandense TaxID=1903569 RepID=UPI002547B3C7